MANTSSRESGLMEFVIKVYPDGHFSKFLAEKVAEGDRLDITGPFGVFTLREGDNDLVFVGGGAGMAPILSLLRSMAERGLERKATFFYGARTKKDLCFEAELHGSRRSCRTSSTYLPCPSRAMTTTGTARPD